MASDSKSAGDGQWSSLTFVCRQSQRHFSTPENELFAYLIDRIAYGLHQLPPWLSSGIAYVTRDGIAHRVTLNDKIQAANAAINRLQRTPYLATIALPHRITEFHLLRADTARMGEFRIVTQHTRRQIAAVEQMQPLQLAALSQRIFVLPNIVDSSGSDLVQRWFDFYMMARNQ